MLIRANRCYRHLHQLSTCEICGLESEDTFHAVVRCPQAVGFGLRNAMSDHWRLPVEDEIVNSGPEWLLMMIDKQPVQVMVRFLLVIWRAWHVRNSLT